MLKLSKNKVLLVGVLVGLPAGLSACGSTPTPAPGPAIPPPVAPMPMPAPGAVPMPAPMPVPANGGCIGPSYSYGIQWQGALPQAGATDYVYPTQVVLPPGGRIQVTSSGFVSNYGTMTGTMTGSGMYSVVPQGAPLPNLWPNTIVGSGMPSGGEAITLVVGNAPILTVNQANQGMGMGVAPAPGPLTLVYKVPTLAGAQIRYGINFLLCQ